MNLFQEFKKGLWSENAVFRQLIGMCPTLAVTNTAINALFMGMATSFVLICTGFTVSLLKSIIPKQVRLAAYVVIIATFVTMADLYLAGGYPAISKALGPYVPLIVVNCLILGRAEAFSSKNRLAPSLADAIGMGLGFTFALLWLGTVREVIGSGSIFGVQILASWFKPWLIMVLPPGAFLSLGITIGLINHMTHRRQTLQHQHWE
jgi:electron transport complex protein RnfE